MAEDPTRRTYSFPLPERKPDHLIEAIQYYKRRHS